MAAPGPSDRVIKIDNESDVLTIWDSIIVGDISGIAKIEQKLQELTGACDTEPRHGRTGFSRADDITITFEPNDGGSPDAVAAFHTGMGTGEPRDCDFTLKTGWGFVGTCFILSAGPPSLPAEDDTLLEVVFRISGTWSLS